MHIYMNQANFSIRRYIKSKIIIQYFPEKFNGIIEKFLKNIFYLKLAII